MMTFTVHCAVNDGHSGYPNIVADLSWSEYSNKGFLATDSYENAIFRHLMDKGAARAKGASGYIIKETGRGRIGEANYRDYLVTYGAKDGGHASSIADDTGDNIEREVRVFCRKEV